jgi:VIT1/CCC1 family predicted Fe2+/Mn2+ transporter
MIKCSECGRMLEDTYTEFIVCAYCGKKTNREEAISSSEEEVRRRVIWDISDKIRKYKMIRNIGYSVGPLLLLLSFLFLFSNIFTLYIQILFVATLAMGIVWLVIGVSAGRKSEASVGRMFDMSADVAE